MKKNSLWNITNIHRLRYELSLENPIRANSIIYPNKIANSSFDMHYVLEMGIVVKGRIQRHYEDFTTILEPGDIWICGMWEPHGYKILQPNSKVIVFAVWPQMAIDLKFLEAPDFNGMSFFTTPAKKRLSIPTATRSDILLLSKRLDRIIRINRPNQVLWFRLLFIELLLILKEAWKIPPQTETLTSNSYSVINKAIQIAFVNRELLTEEKVAKICGISRNAFNVYFEKMMGISFSKFALRHRLSSAASQLIRTDDPIKAIATDWGFTDASHLSHSFLQYYNCSPAEYRNKFRK
ncbi:MAG: hypothetical protein A2044_06110 [Candidatus Firestonebacteria bacterium GWA2_43_8]|nr:MAG: hypothetical protein A2044_06110 [Candidatus Firestonebacteria bacterium GWA2_43_8]